MMSSTKAWARLRALQVRHDQLDRPYDGALAYEQRPEFLSLARDLQLLAEDIGLELKFETEKRN